MKKTAWFLGLCVQVVLGCSQPTAKVEPPPTPPTPPSVPIQSSQSEVPRPIEVHSVTQQPRPVEAPSQPLPESAKRFSSSRPNVHETIVQEKIWRMLKGRLTGAEPQPAPKLVSKFKNEKTGSVSIDKCWNYGTFAIVESKTTGELGSGEVIVRHQQEPKLALCGAEFKGKAVSLKIGEASLVGVAGDWIVMEGADSSEGVVEFELFSVSSGLSVYKSHHLPTAELSLIVNGDKASLVYFAKLDVKCELAAEGAACWKKVLELNHVQTNLTMPDCAGSFKKAGVPNTESALVTTRVKVANLAKPKLDYLNGPTTCRPAPQ